MSKFVTHTGLYCSKQLETTFNRVGKKSLHITFKAPHKNYERWRDDCSRQCRIKGGVRGAAAPGPAVLGPAIGGSG